MIDFSSLKIETGITPKETKHIKLHEFIATLKVGESVLLPLTTRKSRNLIDNVIRQSNKKGRYPNRIVSRQSDEGLRVFALEPKAKKED